MEIRNMLRFLILFVAVFAVVATTQASESRVISNIDSVFEKDIEVKPIFFLDEEKVLAICQSTAKIPTGWVVISQGNVNDCRDNSIAQPLYNAWFIKKPAKEESVCQNSPLPDNYVVVEKIKIADCPGGNSIIENKNGWIIKLIE